MLIFQIIGMAVVTAVILMIIALIITLIINFFAYQKGARNYRQYVYAGKSRRSSWFWFVYGAKTWFSSFRHGSGWFVTVGDPEDDNYDLEIYEDGRIVRARNRYAG